MSLSEHERTQFNRLTEVFAADDPAAVKRLQRTASTNMAHISPDDLWMVAIGAIFLGIVGIATGFMSVNPLQPFLSFVIGGLGYLLWTRYPGKGLIPRRR